MFQHDCLDTCCFECLICVCFGIFVFAPVHMERHSRNKLIIIIIINGACRCPGQMPSPDSQNHLKWMVGWERRVVELIIFT